MNSYYIFGLLFIILIVVFFSFTYFDRRKESEPDVKTENQAETPTGIEINQFGDLVALEDYKGIYIRVSPREEISRADAKLLVEGIVGIFVNPGAAMATWQEFPENVIFYVKDLSTGKIYESLYLEKSISWDGTPDFGPTNQVVQNTFDKNIFQNGVFSGVESLDDKLKPGTTIEVYATFEGMTSNTLKIRVE